MQRFGGFALVLVLAGGWIAPPLVRAQGTGTAAATVDSTMAADTADSVAAEPSDTGTVAPSDTGTVAPSDTGTVVETPAATAAPPEEQARKSLAISGYVTGGYTYSTANVGNSIVGRLYDRFHDEIQLDAAKVVVEMPVATDKVDAGARVDLLLGQNAAVIKSAGLNLGDNADVTQAFATLNVPAGEGKYVQFKAGKIATLMGLEVIEDVVNPNLSEGNQFIYVENFTATGLRVDVKPAAAVDFQLQVFNGWDVVEDNNSRLSFMGRVGFTPTSTTTVGVLGFFGPEQSGNDDDDRYGAEILVSQKLAGGRAAVYLQGDYGQEQNLVGPGENAEWWAVGVWGTYDIMPTVGIAVRGDYVDDRDGARTSGILGFPSNARHKFGSGTATLNIRVFPGALIRPEIRYDRSNLPVYDDEEPSQNQVSFALGASYIF